MTNAELTNILETATQIRINGRKTVYTVVKASDMGASIVGPRGGHKTIVRNINSGNLRLITMAGYRGRAELVETLEVVA